MRYDVDVLVAGAGPTGLTLASELRRHGVPCRIIDKQPAPAPIAKATGIMPRTLEVFHQMGCLESFLEQGVSASSMETLTADGAEVMALTFDPDDTPYPFLLSIEQNRTEGFLNERLEALGGTVERGVGLRSFTTHDDGVLAQTSAGPLRVKYLVGCDGAHSTVRHALDLPFSGAAYPEDFVLVHGTFHWDFPRDRVLTFLAEAGCAYANPLPDDTWLAVADLAGSQKAYVHDGEPTPEELTSIFSERVPGDLRISDPRWTTFFRIHHRQVDRYQVGRVFLAGDAAHIHSPFGGQGMNTGIQDAYNLGWKLAAVLRHGAAPKLLDSYHPERHPVGRSVQVFTHQLQTSSSLRGPVQQGVRNALLRCLGHVEVVGHHIARQIGETVYTYRHGPLAEEDCNIGFHLHADARHPSIRDCRSFHAGPHAGSRAPDARLGSERLWDLLRGPFMTLLLFEGTHGSPHEHRELARWANDLDAALPGCFRTRLVTTLPHTEDGPVPTHFDAHQEAHDRYGARGQCAYLVRPDGYIGYRSQPIDADGVGRYAQERLGFRRPRIS